MKRVRVLIRSIRENPVALASTPDPVERIFVILSRSVGLRRPFDATVRQLRTRFKFLLTPKPHKPARKRS